MSSSTTILTKPSWRSGSGGGGETLWRRMLRRTIEGNLCYLVSAVLVMLGCYLLMQRAIGDGLYFYYTLKTLLILQFYELLVIGTAVIVVRRLGTLGDAAMLLMIEMVLLLDPTFFSNSFATMELPAATLVNGLCLALVPLKLEFMRRGLRLEASRSAWGAFMIAAVVAYQVEGLMIREMAGQRVLMLYYALCWVPLLLALMQRPTGTQLSAAERGSGFVTRSQLVWLNRVVVLAPMAIVVAHCLESATVHEDRIRLYAFHFAPIVLALGWMGLVNAPAAIPRAALARLDVAVVGAIALTLPLFNSMIPEVKISSVTLPRDTAPAFMADGTVLWLTATVAIGLYGWAMARLQDRRIYRRVAVVASIILIQAAYRHGWMEIVGGATVDVMESVGFWMRAYPWIVASALWLGMVALFVKYPHALTFLGATVPALLGVVWMLPGGMRPYGGGNRAGDHCAGAGREPSVPARGRSRWAVCFCAADPGTELRGVHADDALASRGDVWRGDAGAGGDRLAAARRAVSWRGRMRWGAGDVDVDSAHDAA